MPQYSSTLLSYTLVGNIYHPYGKNALDRMSVHYHLLRFEIEELDSVNSEMKTSAGKVNYLTKHLHRHRRIEVNGTGWKVYYKSNKTSMYRNKVSRTNNMLHSTGYARM